MQSHRVPLSILLLLAVLASASAQSHKSVTGSKSLAGSGATWAMQAMAALTGGIQVTSLTESGSVVRTIGGDRESGAITVQSTGIMSSQVTISTTAGNRSETRSWDGRRPSGQWTDLDGQPHPMPQFNCWTDAVWFFPALSLLSGYSDPTLVFTDLGQQQYSGGSVEHIQVYRYYSELPLEAQRLIQQLSTVDYYRDSQTALPVAMAFSAHGNHSLNFDVPVAVVFSQYQSVGGVQVPFQVTQLLNGSSLLQITITSAVPNGRVHLSAGTKFDFRGGGHVNEPPLRLSSDTDLLGSIVGPLALSCPATCNRIAAAGKFFRWT